MRGILTAAACAVVTSVSFAQQDPQYTQFMFDRLSVNSGVAGTSGNICATALLRQQWSGFDGAPKTGLINVQGPITKINSGIGLSVYFDKLGQEKSTIARLHYAYLFKPGGGTGTLGVGLYAGLSSRALGNQWVAVDPVTDDDAIPDNGSSASGFDMGAGISPQDRRAQDIVRLSQKRGAVHLAGHADAFQATQNLARQGTKHRFGCGDPIGG